MLVIVKIGLHTKGIRVIHLSRFEIMYDREREYQTDSS